MMRAYPLIRSKIVPALHNQGLNKSPVQAGFRGPAIRGRIPSETRQNATRDPLQGRCRGVPDGPLNVGAFAFRLRDIFATYHTGSGP
jgi:hypothetical protein